MKSLTIIVTAVLLCYKIHTVESEPRFTNEPTDYRGLMNNFRGLRSTVVGAIDPKYQWYHNGSKIDVITMVPVGSILLPLQKSIAMQGVYQLFVTARIGKFFGREIKVEFMVAGSFFDDNDQTLNVTVGQQLTIDCPPHGYTKYAIYKWGGLTALGTWLFSDVENALVMGDGRLFFSHVTKANLAFIKQKHGIRCLVEANEGGSSFNFQKSGVFRFKTTGENITSFGPDVQKIPNQEVARGDTVKLRCVAAGYPTPKYRWEKTDLQGKKSQVFHQIDGVDLLEYNRVLLIENVKSRNAGNYTCHVTIDENNIKRTASEETKVVVREPPTFVKTIVSSTPNIFSRHTWSCLTKGDPEPTLQWYANTTAMSNVSNRYTIENGTLTIHSVEPSDNGMYQCVAKNAFGFAYQTVSLQVQVKPPDITSDLKAKDFTVGDTGQISCISEAIPRAKHDWFFKGEKLEINKTTKYDLKDDQDLLVHNLSHNDSGIYACIASNMFGSVSKDRFIKVAEIVFIKRPENKTDVMDGESFSLLCEADSDPPLNIRYKWLYNGAEMMKSNALWDLTNKKLTISNAKSHDSGVYTCIAYSSSSEKRSSAIVIVHGPPEAPENLRLHGTCTNFTANLTWIISYRNPYKPLTGIQLQWGIISHDTITWYNASDHVQGNAEGHILKGLKPYAEIVFRAFAENVDGLSESSNVTKGPTCKTPAEKPSFCPIIVNGSSTRPHDIRVTWQEVPKLHQNGPGFGYVFQYRKSGLQIWQQEVLPVGSAPEFTINNTAPSELWEFRVLTYNSEGTSGECPTTQARSGEDAMIIFTKRPQNKTDVKKGESFSLECEAYSKPDLPMKYKWFHNGKDLGKSNQTLNVTSSQLQDSGEYKCRAFVKTNIYNTGKTSTALVIVNGPPNAPQNLNINGGCRNFTANLTWTLYLHPYDTVDRVFIQWSVMENMTMWYNVTDNMTVSGNLEGRIVKGLNPYTDIVFRVIAENVYGLSEPSNYTKGQTCKTPADKPSFCPINVNGSSIRPHDIRVTWQEVPKLHQSGPGFGYVFQYRKSGLQIWQQEVLPVGSAPEFTINNTAPSELWEFRVLTYNSEGTSGECPTTQAQSGKDGK
ncbi:contactin-6-like isoform X2 [Xenia sp. Carnegie-2017]|uniref:contactin-6-like isoform X2 n=1 Tax=Xenia sp. Carnegie-2017 TaxID=2897299 RepID=UPI001F04CEAE|nr:contactin-6-like isoform X2 [Xenia sp. Carnegie-2017]